MFYTGIVSVKYIGYIFCLKNDPVLLFLFGIAKEKKNCYKQIGLQIVRDWNTKKKKKKKKLLQIIGLHFCSHSFLFFFVRDWITNKLFQFYFCFVFVSVFLNLLQWFLYCSISLKNICHSLLKYRSLKYFFRSAVFLFYSFLFLFLL